jgi:hypothetical protein
MLFTDSYQPDSDYRINDNNEYLPNDDMPGYDNEMDSQQNLEQEVGGHLLEDQRLNDIQHHREMEFMDVFCKEELETKLGNCSVEVINSIADELLERLHRKVC